MTPVTRLCSLSIISLWLVIPASAADSPEVRWNELHSLITGREVSVPLSAGSMVAGKAIDVNADSLLLDVSRTSDSARYPKGRISIPRAAISEIRYLDVRESNWRKTGAVLGALAGFVGGMAIAESAHSSDAAGIATLSGSMAAGGFGGYYAGRHKDRRWVRLRIAKSREGG